MATPQQLLQTARAKIAQPNNQGTRGGPARGGIASRPRENGFLQADGAMTPPDSNAKVDPGGTGAPTMGRGPKLLGSAPASGMPAWQRLAEMGVGGQGSAAANKAKLAELEAGQAGREVASNAAGSAPTKPAWNQSSAPAPGLPQPMGGPVPPPPPGAHTAVDPGFGTAGDAGMAKVFPSGFPGFRPRDPMGGGVVARPMPATIPQPAGVTAQTMPGNIPNETPGGPGGGFDALGRVGAGLAARRQLRPGERSMNELGDPWPQ